MLKSVVRPTRVHIVCATYKTIAAKEIIKTTLKCCKNDYCGNILLLLSEDYIDMYQAAWCYEVSGTLECQRFWPTVDGAQRIHGWDHETAVWRWSKQISLYSLVRAMWLRVDLSSCQFYLCIAWSGHAADWEKASQLLAIHIIPTHW